MHVPGYEPLPRDDEESQDPPQDLEYHNNNNAAGTSSSAKSPTYYGETDNPSSEAEDEALLEKEGLSSPGLAERGGLDAENIEVGGETRVRRSILYACLLWCIGCSPTYLSIHSSYLPAVLELVLKYRHFTATVGHSDARHCPWGRSRFCSDRGHCSGSHVQGNVLPRSRCTQIHNGPYI